MSIVLFSKDLLFCSRIRVAAQSLEVAAAVVSSIEALQDHCQQTEVMMVFLDLTVTKDEPLTVVSQVRDAAPNARIVAFAPHVRVARLEAARQAGCDLVMTRGQLDRDMLRLLRNAI